VSVEVVGGDPKIPVEEEKQLLLHEIDFWKGEQAHSVSGPVLVLWRRIVEVFSRENQCSEEDSMAGAMHALGYFGEARLESVKVDRGRHERGCLYIRSLA
jgi:hypothetical protein